MEQLNKDITERYSDKHKTSCSLSCGDNYKFLSLKPGNKVLDLGCGYGRDTLKAANLVGNTGLAVGLDLTPKMVEAANEIAVRENIKNVRFVVGNIEQLPFNENSFDIVVSNCVINHARNKTRVFHEINRVLKIKGIFVISDVMCKYPLPDNIKNDSQQWAGCFGGAVTPEEYLKCIEKAKFISISVVNSREYIKNGYEFISLTIKAGKTN